MIGVLHMYKQTCFSFVLLSADFSNKKTMILSMLHADMVSRAFIPIPIEGRHIRPKSKHSYQCHFVLFAGKQHMSSPKYVDARCLLSSSSPLRSLKLTGRDLRVFVVSCPSNQGTRKLLI